MTTSEVEKSLALSGNASSVQFDTVTKVYGVDVVAVDGVSLQVNAGELVTLLGPSGCGKTTTLRMIAGLEMATSGAILIGDKDVTRLPATDRDVSMVFQSYALFPHMTVIENVSYGLRVSGMPKAETRQRAEHGLELVGLQGYSDRLPSELSGEQQQRVAVARALVLEPQVLLFDEPLSNLDAKLRRQVREEIRDLQTTLGLTVVYVTHDQEEALAVSDRIIVMRNAAIAQIGTPRELYETPADNFVADFIGESNTVDAVITDVNSTDEIATVNIGSLTLSLPSRGLTAGPARVAIRPNRIILRPQGSTPAADNTSQGTILKSTYVGNHMEYRVATEFGEWFATSDDVDQVLTANQAVDINFAERGPVLLPA
ncbi:MAG: ABC transporter ATP-binding protein [Granulosicoccus sp.]|nr:ABC transporter ATP-binding protein [Granulosicoccus sp.]